MQEFQGAEPISTTLMPNLSISLLAKKYKHKLFSSHDLSIVDFLSSFSYLSYSQGYFYFHVSQFLSPLGQHSDLDAVQRLLSLWELSEKVNTINSGIIIIKISTQFSLISD